MPQLQESGAFLFPSLMLFQSERLPDRATTVMRARVAAAPSCSGFTIGQIGGTMGACPLSPAAAIPNSATRSISPDILPRTSPMRKARSFDPEKYRDNPKMIAEYLNVALATDDTAVIVKAIGDMLRAQGVARISEKSGLRREGLYRSFEGHRVPGFDTVLKVLLALDVRLVTQSHG
jgi:probable addiction module antidote protein